MSRIVLINVVSPFHSLSTPFNISIERSQISEVGVFKSQPDDYIIEFDSALAIPGLFNAHDHLDFSLFPKLGNGPYRNYIDWGNDIHARHKSEIQSVLQIPVELRWKMGLLKNIVSGVTTLIDHKAGNDQLKELDIELYTNYQYIHSLATDSKWKVKLLFPTSKPIMIHLGEGVDPISVNELSMITKANLLHRKIIAVHLISGSLPLTNKLGAIIWCPDSNLFLYNQTAPVNDYDKSMPVFFGTDSPLSASENIWEQIRLARSLKLFTDEKLFKILNSIPCDYFKMSKGSLVKGVEANIVVIKSKSTNPNESFFSSNPEDILLIIKRGRIILFDESLKGNKMLNDLKYFEPICVNESVKYLHGKWAELIKDISQFRQPLPLKISLS